MSHKIQITLPDDLVADLKSEAAKLGISLTEFIRQTMKKRLQKGKQDANPLASITGIIDSEERYLAAQVDEILY